MRKSVGSALMCAAMLFSLFISVVGDDDFGRLGSFLGLHIWLFAALHFAGKEEAL